MRLLYFSWYENSYLDAKKSLDELGVEVDVIYTLIQDYCAPKELEQQLKQVLTQKKYDGIFSFDYMPFLTSIAEQYRIPYLAWIYDCPHYTLYAKQIFSHWNYLFLFDRVQYQQLVEEGVPHVMHLPLAVQPKRLNEMLGPLEENQTYDSQISFVGSLYEPGNYDRIQYLPAALKGYLDGIMEAQQHLPGNELIEELLTEEKVNELARYVKIEKQGDFFLNPSLIYSDMLKQKVTSMDRIRGLKALGKYWQTDLYTNSQWRIPVEYSGQETENCGKIVPRGITEYFQEMPVVFRKSRINLNFTLRSITSGIPLRALDIMAAGGFLLSNPQPELMEYFEEGTEFAAFYNERELLEKAEYYLNHNEEREKIRRAGWEKVCREFSYKKQFQKLLAVLD